MIPQLTHVGLFTTQIRELEEFYTNVIGLVVTDRGLLERLGNIPIVFLSGDELSHHQLVLAESDKTTYAQQLSFKVDSLSELRLCAKRALDYNVNGYRPWDHGNAWSVYFFDPDGNLVEIYMDTPWHVTQPHGRPLDLTMTDDEIHGYTLSAIQSDPTFMPMEEWKKDLKARLNNKHNMLATDNWHSRV
jgi:catechol 2,3-dioxygenase